MNSEASQVIFLPSDCIDSSKSEPIAGLKCAPLVEEQLLIALGSG